MGEAKELFFLLDKLQFQTNSAEKHHIKVSVRRFWSMKFGFIAHHCLCQLLWPQNPDLVKEEEARGKTNTMPDTASHLSIIQTYLFHVTDSNSILYVGMDIVLLHPIWYRQNLTLSSSYGSSSKNSGF